jgi:hypothetical protein
MESFVTSVFVVLGSSIVTVLALGLSGIIIRLVTDRDIPHA